MLMILCVREALRMLFTSILYTMVTWRVETKALMVRHVVPAHPQSHARSILHQKEEGSAPLWMEMCCPSVHNCNQTLRLITLDAMSASVYKSRLGQMYKRCYQSKFNILPKSLQALYHHPSFIGNVQGPSGLQFRDS